jgi:hypothetical protein
MGLEPIPSQPKSKEKAMNKHGTNISSLTQTGSKSSTTIARLARGSFLIVFGFAMAGALVNPAYAKSWEKTKAERLGRPGARECLQNAKKAACVHLGYRCKWQTDTIFHKGEGYCYPAK